MKAGEVCVGQELGLLVEGERGLLVLQVGSWDTRVGVSHAAPDWAAGVGTPHAAASWLIHGDAIYDKSFPSRGVEPPSLSESWEENPLQLQMIRLRNTYF